LVGIFTKPKYPTTKHIIMENQLVGFWNERKGKLKMKYPIITDEDLNFYRNKEKEMIERLSYKLGKTQDELRTIINTIK